MIQTRLLLSIRAKNPKILGATILPKNIETARNPKAFTVIRAIELKVICPTPAAPGSKELTMPLTTPRIISPSTSSIMAAVRTILASFVWSRSRSARTLAVIPTLVAVNVAPVTIATSPTIPASRLSKENFWK